MTRTDSNSLSSAGSCFGNDGYIYSLAMLSSSLILTKQQYTKGTLEWQYWLYGTYGSTNYNPIISDTSSPYYIYALTYRNDISGCNQFGTVMKIDVSVNPP